MIYRILADTVIIVHFLFILFVLFGALLIFLHKRWLYVHLPAAIWGIIIEIKAWVCPLTPLENWFRQQAGSEIYAENFIEHYLSLIIYPPFLTPDIQIFFAAAVFIINFFIYLWYYHKLRSQRMP